MLEQLRACYGANVRVPPHLLDAYKLAAEGFFMAAEASTLATRSIVSSTLASELLFLDTAGSVHPEPLVLPLAFPTVGAEQLRRAEPADASLIVSLGLLHEIKRPYVLIEALRLLDQKRRPSLVFAGPNLLRNPEAFRDYIRAVGLEDRVSVTGWLTDEDYRRLTVTADVVVQLRERSYGESSAAVTEAMALGRAVITSVAACADFPPGVHVQVAEDVSAAALAAELALLLDDARQRAELEDGAAALAREWSFDRVAAELVNLALDGTAP
jgi:glycosyltransferase involved in cell wall biosynthesis